MPTLKLTTEILTAALLGFEEQKRRIDQQMADIRQMLGGGQPTPEAGAAPRPARGKRRMNAAARKRIGDAQRKRWAAFHEAKPVETPERAATKNAPAKKAAVKKVIAKKAAAKKQPRKKSAKAQPSPAAQ